MTAGIQKKWVIADVLPSEVDSALADFPPAFRQILYNRGVRTMSDAIQFLHPDLSATYDPFLLTGMEDAVRDILAAIDRHELIAVYGDYDVDGVTATTLLVEVLQKLGGDAIGYIPNRFDEGYGLHPEAMHQLFERGVKLVITVDCGIRSNAEVIYAQELGMRVIISDHHTPLGELPPTTVICQKQVDDTYPFKDLAGVGLAYKIAAGLFAICPQEGISAEDWLDLVALGTVADILPLKGENRVLVRKGLDKIRTGSRQGLRALAGVSKVDIQKALSSHIGFALGPRLNAAGRRESAMAALDLLLETDVEKASLLAQQLDDQNRERQVLTQEIQQRALDELSKAPLDDILFYFDTEEHFSKMSGVVGLAAARLTEMHYRPSVVGCIGPDTTRASCRSIPEFHITEALDECSDLLVHHGGHAMAAGFTVLNKNIPELQERLRQISRARLKGLDLQPLLKVDMVIPLTELHPSLLDAMAALEPTGLGNPEPIYACRGLRVQRAKTVGNQDQHLKMTVTDGTISYDAIGFRQGHWLSHLPQRIDIVFTFEMNQFNGFSSLQLNVRDIRDSSKS